VAPANHSSGLGGNAYLNITPEQIRAHVADGALRFVNVAALSISARRP
jgi:hypothetical protein